jgi:diaminopimelate decarboxylase
MRRSNDARARVEHACAGHVRGRLITAVSRGVQTFSVESLSDLERVGSVARRFGTVIDCLLRVNAAGTTATASVGMTGTPVQRGIDRETLRAEHLPPPEIGDVITVPNVGAYGATANLLLFLSSPSPREVVVQGGKIVTTSQLQVRRNRPGKQGF